MAFDVDRTHVDGAVETEQRSRGGGRDAVLTGTGLGDHPLLAHAPGEQRLAEHVVDLVRTGVREVLALEEHAHAEPLGEAGTFGDRSRAPRVGAEEVCVLLAERVVVPGPPELRFELFERVDQGLGRVPAAEFAEPAEADRLGTGLIEVNRRAAAGTDIQGSSDEEGGSIIRVAPAGADPRFCRFLLATDPAASPTGG